MTSKTMQEALERLEMLDLINDCDQIINCDLAFTKDQS